ncbi:MAG: GTP 3',8-cyclase MoaA [Phycisphaera sp.]|nr:GTP 3',8-cyclase MoaA [Phycisphaera sp.]
MTVALPILETQPIRPDFATGPRDLDSVRLIRLSVTDRCNLRCVYCMTGDGIDYADRDELLHADDFLAVASAAAEIGVSHFKITGGEPTVRHDLPRIIEGLAGLDTREPLDLSLTTNGLNLERIAPDLCRAGLGRLTISWDSMNPGTFDRITGGHLGHEGLRRLLRGIDAAVRAGFEKLKINVVVMAGVNDHEAVDFARLTLDKPWTVRFIEYMPLGESVLTDDPARYTVDNELLRNTIAKRLGPLQRVERSSEPGVGPAEVYTLSGAVGRLGFISAMSRPFCENCNRLRLTARGELRSCLFDGGEVSVLDALRPVPDPGRLVELMRRCVALKPDVHSARGNRAMSQIGG